MLCEKSRPNKLLSPRKLLLSKLAWPSQIRHRIRDDVPPLPQKAVPEQNRIRVLCKLRPCHLWLSLSLPRSLKLFTLSLPPPVARSAFPSLAPCSELAASLFTLSLEHVIFTCHRVRIRMPLFRLLVKSCCQLLAPSHFSASVDADSTKLAAFDPTWPTPESSVSQCNATLKAGFQDFRVGGEQTCLVQSSRQRITRPSEPLESPGTELEKLCAGIAGQDCFCCLLLGGLLTSGG